RAGCWVAHTCAIRGVRDAAVATAMFAIGYGGLVTILALVARSEDLGPNPGWAALGGGLLAALAGGFGIVRRSHLGMTTWRQFPTELQATCFGGLAGFLALVLGGGLLLAGAIISRFDQALAMARSLEAGV